MIKIIADKFDFEIVYVVVCKIKKLKCKKQSSLKNEPFNLNKN